MSLRRLWLLALSLAACADEEPFVSLPKFCEEFASAVCEGRAGCCRVDPAACESAERTRCDAVLMQVESERLDYDAARATKRFDAARQATNACGSPPSIASFFEGGLATGTACERDAQCASGSCSGEPRACVDTPPAPLCPP